MTWHDSVEDMVARCDVVTINCPLHPETENLFDEAMIGRMKRGAYLVNTARGKIVDRDAVARALEEGRLAGYAGDVWFPQPAPRDHPWRTMPHNGMTPHISGTSPLRPGALRRGNPRDPRMLAGGPPDPRRISDRRGRPSRRRRRPQLQRRRRDRRLRGGGAVQEALMTSSPSPSPSVQAKPGDVPSPQRVGGPTQDELLDEALEETFPASDPTSVYRLD